MSESNEIEYSLVGNIEDIPENSRLFIDFNDEPVVILNLAGQLYAIGDIVRTKWTSGRWRIRNTLNWFALDTAPYLI
jgi:hypothetical protein